MSTFYNYLFRDCLNQDVIFDVKFYSWTGSTGGGEDRLDIDEIWSIQDTTNNEIYGCYEIIGRYLGEVYEGEYEITQTLIGDDFTFINYSDCTECEGLLNMDTYDDVMLNNYENFITPIPTGTPAGTPGETPTPTGTPRETPTPTDPNDNRLIPTIGYYATFSDCLTPPGTYTGYINDTFWSTISGDGVSNIYTLSNTNCYKLENVDVGAGVQNVPSGAIYISGQSDIVTNCCPPEPTTTVTATPPEPPGPEPNDCTLYELTNSGSIAGDVTYTLCEGSSTTVTVNPNENVFVCSENVPQYTNQGFDNFGLVKTDFTVSGTQAQPVQFITGYNYDYGNPEDVDLNTTTGTIIFLPPEGSTGTTLGPVTFTINVSYYWNSVLGGCGEPDFYIYRQDDSGLTEVGSPTSWVDNQLDEFTLTYTDNNAQYNKYYILGVSGCPWITYFSLSFGVDYGGDTIQIEHQDLGPCQNTNEDCGQFVIDYQADGGCGENTTYTVTVSNIDAGSGPYVVTLNTGAAPIQTNGEDVIFENVNSGLISIMVDDLSDVCDRVTKQVYLPSLSTPIITTQLVTAPDCFDCDGEVNLTYQGYTLPVTIEVYSGLTGNPNVLVESFSNVNTNTYNITNLCGGTNYRFQITDINGCTNKDIYTVPSTTEVTNIFAAQIANSDCGIRDSIYVMVQNNGSPVTYSITGSTGYVDSHTTTQGQHTFENIPTGVYDIQVTTIDGCVKDLGPITITNPDMYNISITNVVDAGCGGNTGSFYLDILAAEIDVQTPIDVFVRRLDGEVAFQTLDTEQTSFSVTNLTQGTYEIEVIDVNGCIQIEEITIYGGTGLDFTVDATDCTETNINGTAELFITGGIPPYTISWSNGETDVEFIDNLSGGTYSVTVTDDGCTLTKTFTIDCPGDDVLGETTTVVCSSTFVNQGSGIDTFEQLTQNALNEAYSVINDSCNYIPSYDIGLTISNINGHDDILINQTIYVGQNINDVLPNSVWTNTIQNILGDLAINHDFIASGYIFNQNFFRIESNCNTDELTSAVVNLSLEISINEQC